MIDVLQLLVFLSVSTAVLLTLPSLRYHVRKLLDEALAGGELSVSDYAGFHFYTTATLVLPYLALSYLCVACLTLLTPCPEYDFSYLASYAYYGALLTTVTMLAALLIVGCFSISRGLRFARIPSNRADVLIGGRPRRYPRR
jgi:hypothetical protein